MAQLAIIKQMSGQVSGGSVGDYQADERAGVSLLIWRLSSRRNRTGGIRDSSLGGYKQNIAHTKTQRKGAVTPQETEPKLLLVWRVPYEGVGCQGITTGVGALAAAILEGTLWCKSSWRSPLTLPYSPQTPELGHLRPNTQQGGRATPPISR